MADTHGNPSRSIARASRAGVSVTQQGDKMNHTTTEEATTTNAHTEEQRQVYEDELHEIINQAYYDIESAILELQSMQKTTYAIPAVTLRE